MKLTPLLQVFDMIEARIFYVDRLGFEVVASSPAVDTVEGHFSHWMHLRKSGVEVMLDTAYDSNERPPSRDDARELGHRDVGMYIECDDVAVVHAELEARGLVADTPQAQRYGMTSFSVRDPDGYAITFQSRA